MHQAHRPTDQGRYLAYRPTRRVALGTVLATLGAPAWVQASEPRAPKAGAACATQATKACQEAVTPAQVVARLKAGNARFVKGQRQARNYRQQVQATAAGQFPLASVVSCIDSRAPAEIVFDQGIGDLFNARVAGNIVNSDILGSLEFASKVAGAKVVLVLGHTSCGAIKGACDDVKLGNLTGLLEKIRPVALSTAPEVKDRSSKNHDFVDRVASANVAATVKAIRDQSEILRSMEQQGQIRIAGAMYDVATGQVAWLS